MSWERAGARGVSWSELGASWSEGSELERWEVLTWSFSASFVLWCGPPVPEALVTNIWSRLGLYTALVCGG